MELRRQVTLRRWPFLDGDCHGCQPSTVELYLLFKVYVEGRQMQSLETIVLCLGCEPSYVGGL